MACSCHQKLNGEQGTERTRPLDQCLFCAQKHFDQAYGAWHEFTYETENRRWIRANLRAIIGHTYRNYVAVADRARELSLLVQQNLDERKPADDKFKALGDLIERLLYNEFPELNERLEKLKSNA